MRIVDALLAALLVTFVVTSRWLVDFDLNAADGFYQRVGQKTDNIVIIGIDQKTVDKYGKLSSWLRRGLAKGIDVLNEGADRPAVIGVDGLISGNNPSDVEGDKMLVEACARLGNVVMACAVDPDNAPDVEGDPYAPWNQILPLGLPYAALNSVVDVGHINDVEDMDGITRHDLLYVNTAERGQIKSLSRVLYERYCDYKGVAAKEPPVTIGNGVFYLPFTATSYYTGINFADLLEGKVAAEKYKDKIVIIGICLPGSDDNFATAITRPSFMYGTEVHANAIEAYAKGFFPREAADFPQVFVLFVVAYCAEFCFRVANMRKSVCLWLGLCAAWLALCKIFYASGTILHVTWIPLALSILFVGAIVTNYALARMGMENLLLAMGRFLDANVAADIAHGKESLQVGGETMNVAVLFVDIRGFTSMSEEIGDPQKVVSILNQYLTLTTKCVMDCKGTVDKFIGDCTMAYWKADDYGDEAVLLAVKAAALMVKEGAALNESISRQYKRQVAFGIGVNWGSAVVGKIGSEARMDYTVIGDTVNTAARLEENAPGGHVYVSKVVADMLKDKANFVLAGDIQMKGKAEPMTIFAFRSFKNGKGGQSIG